MPGVPLAIFDLPAYRILRPLAAALAAIPAMVGAGFIAWALMWPRTIRTAPGAGGGDGEGFLALFFGAALLVVAVPYAIAALLVYLGKWWGILGLALCCTAQGGYQTFWCADQALVVAYGCLLLGAATLCTFVIGCGAQSGAQRVRRAQRARGGRE